MAEERSDRHRLSRIATRSGDDGRTGLTDGSRVRKDDARVHAMGDVDELNAALGTLATEAIDEDIRVRLIEMQQDLLDLGGALSLPGARHLTEAHLRFVDEALEHYNAALPPLREFVLPGGCAAGAAAHQARTVCRRAERSVVTLASAAQACNQPIDPRAAPYLNRLSDLLFVLSRVINRRAGSTEAQWQPRRRLPPSGSQDPAD